MAVLLFNDPLEYVGPSRQLSLGLEPEDFFEPFIPRQFRNLIRYPTGYLRPWRSLVSGQDVASTTSFDKNKFQANLDVQQFKPEEIKVTVSENTVTVEGKHEEKRDEHGYISRQFVRKYVLPKGHDMNKIESKLSSDGVLTITAPKTDSEEETQRSIPVVQTGQPSKPVEQQENKKGN